MNGYEFRASLEYAAKKQADESSYVWDNMIEWLTAHTLDGTLLSGGERPLHEHEEDLRLLASAPRVVRRGLADALLGLLVLSDSRWIYPRSIGSPLDDGHWYVFLTMRRSNEISEDEYRELRQRLLCSYCELVKVRNPEVHRVTGLAFGATRDNDSSIDHVVVQFEGWTNEDSERVLEHARFMRWSEDNTRLNTLERVVREYPVSRPVSQPTRGPRPTKNAELRKRKRKAEKLARRRSRG